MTNKDRRIKAGWGLREIAIHVGVAPQTVVRWEKTGTGRGPKFRNYLSIIGGSEN